VTSKGLMKFIMINTHQFLQQRGNVFIAVGRIIIVSKYVETLSFNFHIVISFLHTSLTCS
jgi:hypothetical protein